MQTEIEVKVLNIDKAEMVQKLESLGAKRLGEFDQKRYVYDIVKNDESQWLRLRQKKPQIKPYIEIEAKDEATVYAVLKKLGYSKQDCTSINTMDIYKQQGIDLDTIAELKF